MHYLPPLCLPARLFRQSSVGGLLQASEADITLTDPRLEDQQAFIEAETPPTSSTATPTGRHSRPPQIKRLFFGRSLHLTPWYSAPYPEEYHTGEGNLWICEWCLHYHNSRSSAIRHSRHCSGRLPPGDEIYRHAVDSKRLISVFEVNGRTARRYCQNLCLLAKMFLDHKTLYYDVDPFLFYVLIEWNALHQFGPKDISTTSTSATSKRESPFCNKWEYSFVGYFSKEKASPLGYNLSCILTMPQHQRKGYGHFLVDFSYLLTRAEGDLGGGGSPEKPLSDLGLLTYASYWRRAVLQCIISSNNSQSLTPLEIARCTGMTLNDVLATLEHLGVARDGVLDVKCVSLVSKPVRLAVDPAKLRWSPYKSLR